MVSPTAELKLNRVNTRSSWRPRASVTVATSPFLVVVLQRPLNVRVANLWRSDEPGLMTVLKNLWRGVAGVDFLDGKGLSF